MTQNADMFSNGVSPTPVKTMWFEFLLEPKRIDSHLICDQNPSSYELITQLLTNILTTTATAIATHNTTQQSVNGNNDEMICGLQATQDNAKNVAIRHLCFKIMAHNRWNIKQLENNLSVTHQDLLLSEFIRYCDRNGANASTQLFSCILYYRWILRYMIKANYPSRSPKGPPIPLTLQQQIDPCFVSSEALDCLMKKLQEQYPIAVNYLEKVIEEKRMDICMPTYQCFKCENNNFSCNWNEVIKLNTCDIIDDILYDIGRWFFFHEEYVKANYYFEMITLTRRHSFPYLDGYLISSRDMITNQIVEIEDTDIIDLNDQINEFIEKLINEHSSDNSFLDGIIDLSVISNALKTAYDRQINNRSKNIITKLVNYLSNKVKGLNSHLDKVLINNDDTKSKVNIDLNNDVDMIEEGEIEAEDEIVIKDNEKDPELLLLEATEPELVQSLVTKIKKHPIMINNRWSLPLNQSKLIQNLPQQQYEKCHIILAKANQLRTAKLFIESRTLYLSLLEDIQASLPQLADVIIWELLRTDLEHHFDNTDVDERRISDLIVKCNRTLRTIDKKNIIEFPELTELCCFFLIQSCASSLKDLFNSSIPIIKFSSCLSVLAFETNSVSVSSRVKDLWDILLSAFVKPMNSKKSQQTPSLIFSSSLINFLSKFKDLSIATLILSCLSRLHNLLRDNASQELTICSQYASLLPSSLGSYSSSLDANLVNSNLNLILNQYLNHMPNEIVILKCKAELSLVDGLYAESIKYFTLILMITTKYFTSFSMEYTEEETIIHRMIHCCVKLGCHTQSAVLHQLTREPNYALAFKAFSERNCNDSCDDLYECIWDVTLLEFLINLHSRRGEIERKTKAIQLIGQLELNSNNNPIVLKEAANVRRGKLLRIFSRTYL